MRRFGPRAVLLAVLVSVQSAAAQEPVRDCVLQIGVADFTRLAGDVARIAALLDSTHVGSFVLRRGGQLHRVDACAAPTALRRQAQLLQREPGALEVLPVQAIATGNSAYPRPSYDGVLWNGRGVNTAITAGAAFRAGPFSAAIAPVIAWSANSDFELANTWGNPYSQYAHPTYYGVIDAPQRFGDGSFATLDAGSSYARVDLAGFGAGLSNESIIWGPSLRNPLLLSGSGPGFPHVFLETSRPLDIWIGRLDAQLFWGRLEESDYFDAEPDNDVRVIAGFLVALHPRPLPGLSLGAGRAQLLTYWPELSLADAFLNPYRGVTRNPSGRGGDNQLLTFFFRLASASGGLEVFGEWARDDHWGDSMGLLRNLDSSQAWTVGLQKVIEHGDNAVRIHAEVTHLADALPSRYGIRAGPIAFYANSSVSQGHTHRGRYIGAPIGTGAETLFAGVDYFHSAGRSAVSFERSRYEDDAYNVRFAPTHGAAGRDSELTLRLGHSMTFGPAFISGELGLSRRYNRGFIGLDDLSPGEPFPREHNASFRIALRLHPRELWR